ncbi:acyl-CoA carboxylase subunit epsilon [Streptomyces sp. QL37]|uniref:acyl-CoA carboxylase subunit epsilon n=1 Tax=Streptomyces sp. QL37 TaxID=2093747 RepID=UPI000CF2F7F2|nr:acyl-CoA carboxylase subunit epsilon [Streptomyces sp. QL37]PPQ57495.1 hypothetical protein C5F59_12940 [Streptomyces sp. QL37]
MTGPTGPAGPPRQELLRVERGHPDAEELAALTAVLLVRTAAVRDTATVHGPSPAGARWRRPERTPAFANPRAWRRETG